MSIIEVIFEVVVNIIDFLRHWRLLAGAFSGFFLAYVAYDGIVNEPLRWIVAGTFAITGIIVGARWQGAR